MTDWKVVSPWKEGATPSEEWQLDDSRLPLTEADAEKVAAYLRSGGVIFRNTEKIPDPLGNASALVVPLSLLTDGEWIWNESLTYFVATHRFCPSDEFMSYLRQRDFEPRVPSAEQVAEALAAIQEDS